MPKRREYRTFKGKQFPYQYTVETKAKALASKRGLQKQGKQVRVTKAKDGYRVWARKPM